MSRLRYDSVTNPREPIEPQSDETQPQRGGEPPRRSAPDEPLPESAGSFFERAVPPPGISPQGPSPLPQYELRHPDDGLAQDDTGRLPLTGDRPPPASGMPSPRDAGVPQGGSLPQRGPNLPQRASDLPQRDTGLPQRGLPQRGPNLPQRAPDLPQRGPNLPQRGSDLPQRAPDLPQRDTGLPQRDPGLPPRGGLPQRAPDLPQRAPDLPQRDTGLPQRGGPPEGLGALPRRTTRTRPTGRHRSPHRLSVASDAPALVLAVPGAAEADQDEIGPRVAAIASKSCPGVDIRVGYLDGAELLLAECLESADQAEGQDQFPSVIVPLLLSPNAQVDPALRQLAGQSRVPAVLATHLGPHPMVAEALHSRLADAGLARQARATGLSIAAENRGIVVLADIGDEALSAAGVAAVLLASRLNVPVVPASLGDPASIVEAVNRLSETGARPVLAPCLIGPETKVSVLEELSTALGAPCAPTLGAHEAVGRLVAIRYGAALATLSLAG